MNNKNIFASVNNPTNKAESQVSTLNELKKVKEKKIINKNSNNNSDNNLNDFDNNLKEYLEDNLEDDNETDDLWFNDVSVLLDVNNLLCFFPNNKMNLAEKLNAICRLSVYLGIILYLFTEKSIYLILIVLVFIGTYLIFFNKNKIVEKLTNENVFRKPTKDNPMMNYNIITAEQKDKKALPLTNNEVKNNVRDKLRKNNIIDDKLYRSTFDLFDKNNSQRQFYSMPATSMPNDQTAFAKWCYSTGPTCKERNLYCAPNYISLNDKR